jgi:hypothetical protein
MQYDSVKVLSINAVRQRKGPRFRLRLRGDDKEGMLGRTHSERTLLLKRLTERFC